MQPSTEDPEDAIQFSIHINSVLQLWNNPDQAEEQIGSTESCKVGASNKILYLYLLHKATL
jgi:hypothetical protein